ncbi:MAG: hypothetical protein Q8L72_00920 [Moraxellaceae bacterium]|nr:hypothetical protein [Moraxellaceae bacterium]
MIRKLARLSAFVSLTGLVVVVPAELMSIRFNLDFFGAKFLGFYFMLSCFYIWFYSFSHMVNNKGLKWKPFWFISLVLFSVFAAIPYYFIFVEGDLK